MTQIIMIKNDANCRIVDFPPSSDGAKGESMINTLSFIYNQSINKILLLTKTLKSQNATFLI